MDTKTRETLPTVRIAAMVDRSLAHRLVQAAASNDRSIAAEIRRALRDYLKENDR